jgi:5-methylcytosine-specific restriction endonuclease McrA
LGNPVLKALRNCEGPLCYQFDHIVPHSKGGDTLVDNCQLLQSTVNKVKSNKVDVTYQELRAVSPNFMFTSK